MKILKLLGIVCTVVGAVAGCAGEFIDQKQTEEFVKEEVDRQLKEKENNKES